MDNINIIQRLKIDFSCKIQGSEIKMLDNSSICLKIICKCSNVILPSNISQLQTSILCFEYKHIFDTYKIYVSNSIKRKSTHRELPWDVPPCDIS